MVKEESELFLLESFNYMKERLVAVQGHLFFN